MARRKREDANDSNPLGTAFTGGSTEGFFTRNRRGSSARTSSSGSRPRNARGDKFRQGGIDRLNKLFGRGKKKNRDDGPGVRIGGSKRGI